MRREGIEKIFKMDKELTVRTQVAELELPQGGLKLENGAALPELKVAYETYGELSPDKDNVIFICHALSGDAHVAGVHEEDGHPGWWDEMVGPGKGIDTNLYYVVCANVLGGCKGTTGPASINPESGKPYGSAFPRITVGDIVEVHRILLAHLGIDHLAAIIGGSFGGMQVLEWAVRHPESINRCICVASATSLSAQALAFDVVGRKAITSDPGWNGGDYYAKGEQPASGLAQARMIGHITYLSQKMMARKFGREKKAEAESAEGSKGFKSDFQVESYLDHQGKKFVDRFDANSYLLIANAMDEFDLGARHGSLESAFGAIKAKMLIVALSEDWLFPPSQSKELANGLLRADKAVSYCELVAPHGHDAFLVDIANLGTLIKAFLPWVTGKGNDDLRDKRLQERSIGPRQAQELAVVTRSIKKESRVLDLGCGDGSLLQYLADSLGSKGLGVDVDLENVISVIDRGLDIFQSDIDAGLSAIPDSSYDYVVINNTLQVVKRPRQVLKEALRIAAECIVTFPNFGNLRHRFSLLLHGRMPLGGDLPFEWYNTPNIHLFTLRDFVELCVANGIDVLSVDCHHSSGLSRALGALGLKNAGADRVTVRIVKAGSGGTK